MKILLPYTTYLGYSAAEYVTPSELHDRILMLQRHRASIDVLTDRAPVDTKIVRHCGCGRAYTAEEFRGLPFVATAGGLQYRNCSCGSTITLELGVVHAPSA